MTLPPYIIIFLVIPFVVAIGMSLYVFFAVHKIRKDKPFPDAPLVTATPAELEKELGLVSVGQNTQSFTGEPSSMISARAFAPKQTDNRK